jgi:hypothetical protein
LFIVIALLALALGYEMNRRRWATLRALALYHSEFEEGGLWSGRQCLDNVVEYERRRRQLVARGDIKGAQTCMEHSALFAEEARRQLQLAEYHAAMRRHYDKRW